MVLISVMIAAAELGVGLWLLNRYVPMSHRTRAAVNAAIALVIAVRTLDSMGIWTSVIAFLPTAR